MKQLWLLYLSPSSFPLTSYKNVGIGTRSFESSSIKKIHRDVSLSESFWSGEFGENSENGLNSISFLPIETIYSFPPRALPVLKKICKTYIESEIKPENKFDIKELFNMLELFYDMDPSRQVTIDGKNVDCHEASIILGFSASVKLPQEITLMLLESATSIPELMKLVPFIEVFANKGWSCVEFKRGLPLWLKREYVVSKRSPKSNRRFIFKNSKEISKASFAIFEASNTVAPAKLMQKEEIEAEMNMLGNKFYNPEIQFEDMKFFPRQNAIKKRIQLLIRQSERFYLSIRQLTGNMMDCLREDGKVGILSYIIINFLFYASFIIWSRDSILFIFTPKTFNINKFILIRNSKRLLIAFIWTVTYSVFTKIPRIQAALVLSSFLRNIRSFFWK